VGYHYLSKQQKEVQFHYILASVLAHFIHPIELANRRRVLSRGFAASCRTIACTEAGGGTDFKWRVVTAAPVMLDVRRQETSSGSRPQMILSDGAA
jgi:hypothetical protein